MDDAKVMARLKKIIEERQEKTPSNAGAPDQYKNDVLWVNAIIALRLSELSRKT